MTNKKMLKLAAKFVNSRLGYTALEYVGGCGWIRVNEDGERGSWWNPLTDSGDAFELEELLRKDEEINFAARRRAIVLAAANICKCGELELTPSGSVEEAIRASKARKYRSIASRSAAISAADAGADSLAIWTAAAAVDVDVEKQWESND